MIKQLIFIFFCDDLCFFFDFCQTKFIKSTKVQRRKNNTKSPENVKFLKYNTITMSEQEEAAPRLKYTRRGTVAGVTGKVLEMQQRFAQGSAMNTPVEAEERRKQSGRAIASTYNMVLRGQQMASKKKKQEGKELSESILEEEGECWDADYPWHITAFSDDEDDAFWMPELALALEQEDEEEINRAVLRFFLEENDPERVDEIDDMLNEFAGEEEVLFVNLHNEYSPMISARKKASSSVVSVGDLGGGSTNPPDRRRSSFVVSGRKKQDGNWEMNATDEELQNKMEESGVAPEKLTIVVKTAQQAAFAPGGTVVFNPPTEDELD